MVGLPKVPGGFGLAPPKPEGWRGAWCWDPFYTMAKQLGLDISFDTIIVAVADEDDRDRWWQCDAISVDRRDDFSIRIHGVWGW
jgi:hypothetical protein